MSEKNVYLVRPQFFLGKQILTITPEYISLGNTDNPQGKYSFQKDEVDSYRYTAKKIRHYVYLYTYVKIEVRSLSGKTIRFSLVSLFGINSKKIIAAYSEIINLLYKYYFIDLVKYYLDLFANNVDFNISGLIFTNKGVQFSDKNEIISWDDIGTKDYISYYAVFSKKDNYNYKGFSYWDDWNTTIIYSITRTILHRKQLKDT